MNRLQSERGRRELRALLHDSIDQISDRRDLAAIVTVLRETGLID
jgi:hypothetical protein